ncbi:MAG: hypothetical protein BGO01_03195 [Armatimonadetes bacterium 55-13]|nr:MAG: hypothetical protein ABT09_00965 [bacterium SCN 57-13]OJU63666.1 MAG: hypothetical protein BGO01_03195 [Armatimonadetes bacterium 55-13]
MQATAAAQSSVAITSLLAKGAKFQDDEQGRSARLSKIASDLDDPKTDGVALLTEAIRLCGFSIWKDDRTKVSDPLTTPGLGLAITEGEIKGAVEMYRRGDRIVASDLFGSFTPLYRLIGGESGMELYGKQFLEQNLIHPRPAVRSLAQFVKELGRTHAEPTDMPVTLDSQLDAIQALLATRVVTEELCQPLRKLAQKSPELFASVTPWQEAEAPGWAEDAFAGGITGIVGEISNRLGEMGEKVNGVVGKINTLSAISKFMMSYQFLKGEMYLEGKGQPLVRTKDFDPGDERTTVVHFYIDGTGATDWVKENRKWFHTVGIDPDTPKSGPLKGAETFWMVDQNQKYNSKQLIQAVRGTTDLARLKTDDNGIAKVTWEGKPQPKKIDPKKAMPVMKKVRIHVSPQMKSVEMQQDLVDAVFGAMGLKDGPTGLLTPLMEVMYRMKWKVAAHFDLQIKDWVEGDTFGQLTVEASGSGSSFSNDSSYQMSIDHKLFITDMAMQVYGAEPPIFDEAALKNFPPEVRKQVEAGMKEAREAAKKRDFFGMGPGRASMSINDSAYWRDTYRDCSVEVITGSDTYRGSGEKDIPANNPNPFNFNVQVNLADKVALVRFEGKVKGAHTRVAGKRPTETKQGEFDFWTNIELEDGVLNKDRAIELPLKETPLQNNTGSNYYGARTIKFKFGPKKAFSGSVIISYSVTRKLPPKEN